MDRPSHGPVVLRLVLLSSSGLCSCVAYVGGAPLSTAGYWVLNIGWWFIVLDKEGGQEWWVYRDHGQAPPH